MSVGSIEIGPLLRVVLDAEAGGALREGLDLKPGDRLGIRVVEALDGGRALIEIGSGPRVFRAAAEVAFAVAAGDRLAVRVVDTQGRLHLSLLPAPGEGAASPQGPEPLRAGSADLLDRVQAGLRAALAAIGKPPAPAPALVAALAGLQSALEPLNPEAGAAANAQRIRALSENSGFFFEKRIEAALTRAAPGAAAEEDPVRRVLSQDLKPRLAAVRHLLEQALDQAPAAPAARAGAALARSIGEMLAEVNRQQESAGRRLDGADPFQVIHFSLPLRGGPRCGKLKIGYPKKGRARRKVGFRACLLLDLDRLGPSRIDLALVKSDLSIVFYVADERARGYVAASLTELKSALAPLFGGLEARVAVSKKKIAAFEAEDWLPAARGRVDVRA
jgi:hypothetical protein